MAPLKLSYRLARISGRGLSRLYEDPNQYRAEIEGVRAGRDDLSAIGSFYGALNVAWWILDSAILMLGIVGYIALQTAVSDDAANEAARVWWAILAGSFCYNVSLGIRRQLADLPRAAARVPASLMAPSDFHMLVVIPFSFAFFFFANPFLAH